MNTNKWVEYEFHFEGMTHDRQALILRLRGIGGRIKKLLSAIPEAEMEIRQGGKWSIKENVGHLIDLEPLHLSRLHELKDRKEILTPADMSNADTEAAHHDSFKIGELIAELETHRNEFVQYLSAMTENELTHSAKHERLNEMMRPFDVAYFVAQHDDHHVNIIKGIIESLEFDD